MYNDLKLNIASRRKLGLVLLGGLLAAALAAPAGAETLVLDPSGSTLTFVLGATGHDVEGTLAPAEGSITFDRASGAAGGKITIDAAKTATGSQSRDEKMHDEVLLSAKFPTISFEPSKLEGQLAPTGKSKVTLHGKVGLLGAGHELALPAEVEIAGDKLVAVSTFKIPFVAWGLHDPSIFVLRVDKEVVVTLRVEGKLSAGQ
jgi:polyisoprenoid-binding protein YceI